MPNPNVARAGLVKTTPSYHGCTLSGRTNRERMIAGNRFPWVKDCSAAKVITLAPVGSVGSKLLFKGGSK